MLYSSRSATEGSSPAALWAGSHEALAAIIRNSPAIVANVAGSVGFTPISMLVITRVMPSAAKTPTAIPMALRSIPCPTTHTPRWAYRRGNRMITNGTE